LEQFETALGLGVGAGDTEAAEAIRDLVETVTVFRDPAHPSGLAVEIAGRLNALLGREAYPNRVKGVWGKGGSEVATKLRPPDAILCLSSLLVSVLARRHSLALPPDDADPLKRDLIACRKCLL